MTISILFVRLGFNAPFNNISFILQQSVLLVEEARVLEKNHRPWQETDKAYHVQCGLNATCFCMVQTQAQI